MKKVSTRFEYHIVDVMCKVLFELGGMAFFCGTEKKTPQYHQHLQTEKHKQTNQLLLLHLIALKKHYFNCSTKMWWEMRYNK